MSARHFDYYTDDWKDAILECPKCGWKGTFEEAGPNYFAEVMDCECPKCDSFEAPILAIVNYSLGDGSDQRPRILQAESTASPASAGKTSELALRNFEFHNGVFRYRSAEEGEMIELQVYYDPGGLNHFSGELEPQGVWIGVCPKRITEGIVALTLLEGPETSGLRFLAIQELQDNPRVFEVVAEQFDEVAPGIAQIWKTNNQGAIDTILARLEKIQNALGPASNIRTPNP